VRRFLPSFAAVTILVVPASAQFFGQPSGFTVENPVLRRLWALGMDSSQASGLAQVLFDSLGPRLTASPGMEAPARRRRGRCVDPS
jgi:carboxypeptidase Q